jgi:hypothetical protein
VKRHFELVPPAEPAPVPAATGWRSKLVQLYASADPRSLGLFRVALGALLAFDVALKFPEVGAHYSNAGWLPNHFALFRPMSDHLFSVYFAFGSPLEVKFLLTLHLLVCLCLMVGYRTKLMQILALLLTTSLNSRTVLVENGGSVVLDILLAWSVFLPLGRRLSLDAFRRSFAARSETTEQALNQRDAPPRDVRPVVSLAVTALILQWATIYFFNTLHKNGAPWRDGTAVHYFLQQDRLVTWFGAWLRDVLPLGLIKLLSFGTLLIEGSVPLLLLLPWRPQLTRMLAFGLVALLHLSIDSVLQLGAFSWAMPLAFVALIPSEAWQWASKRWRAKRTPCVVHFDPSVGASLVLCRGVKRLDGLGLVTFRALDEASPKKAQRGFCVSVEGAKAVLDWDALLAVGDALWCGRRPLLLLGPLVRRRVTRRLTQLATAPRELDLDFGLEALPLAGDVSAPEPTPAQQAWAQLRVALREAAVVVVLMACASQVLLENPGVPQALKPRRQPALFAAIVGYPRIYQGWSMFAPAPPMGDGRLVIDGRTKDGRRFDPLTGREPVFEVHPAGSPRTNLIWGYFHTRIAEDRFRAYWNGVRDFVMNHHKLTDRPEDELLSFDAYYVSETFPAPGAKRLPPERRKLFSNSFVPSEAPTGSAVVRPRSKPAKGRAQ